MTVADAPVVQPVLLGGDFGVYALARSFHEAYGATSIVLSHAPTVAISRSAFCRVEPIVAHASDEELLATLGKLADTYADRALVLVANHDLHSEFIARHWDALSQHYALPFPSMDVIDRVTDKGAFAQLCDELGVPTPATRVVSFRDFSAEAPVRPEIPFSFPVVAKAARGNDYDALEFEGKRKIWFVESQEELNDLWDLLGRVGFRGDFIVQELIPGDNTQMRSVTAYVDSHGHMTLIGSARVLLEDHAPTMIGNPVAMITEAFPQLWEDARRILEAANYRGFANFDVKIDPRDGRALFFEVNPRIGRNSWYMTAAGHNPMIPMVDDLVRGVEHSPEEVNEEILYSMVPDRLLLRYIREPELAQRVRSLIREGKRFDPLFYSADSDLRRSLTLHLQKLNHYRKFHRYYPQANDRSF